MISFILVLITLLVIIVYYFLIWNFDYWHRRGVRGPKPQALFGSYPNLLMRKQHFADDLHEIYKRHKKTDNFVGTFLMRTPQLLILNPQIVHDIFVTAFNHFEDNDVGKLIDKTKDPLIAKNPFILIGDEWREQRSLITPGLTSTRIKQAHNTMSNICQQMESFIVQQGLTNINGKDLSLRFTAESLSDCILGIKAHSFTTTPLPISENVKKFAEENVAFIVFTVIVGLLPNILDFYRAKFFPKDCEAFFMQLMSKAYSMRNTSQERERNDILSHLMKIKEFHKLKETDMYSHTMTFLIDGLDTAATVISHCLLMLALEQSAQDILHQEVSNAQDETGGISFEKLNEMPYLDACIHETLRIYPPGLWSTKCCTQRYKIRNKDDDQFLTVDAGESIIVPIYALHHDPEYYPEPEKFKPERFLPENGGVKRYRDHGVFLGFGDGPRTCLGMRFALVQCKTAISSLVASFRIKANPRTKSEFKLDPKCFLALHNGGVWLDFEKR